MSQPQRLLYHGTSAFLLPGDTVYPGSEAPGQPTAYPVGEEWRSEYVWTASTPNHAATWVHGWSDRMAKVYEVVAADAQQHDPGEYDIFWSRAHSADQWIASSATVLREVPRCEWGTDPALNMTTT